MVAFLAALPALASLGGTIASSIIGGNAAEKAAEVQAAALARAQAFQRENRQFALSQFNPTITATSDGGDETRDDRPERSAWQGRPSLAVSADANRSGKRRNQTQA